MGGWISVHWGGINTPTAVLIIVTTTLLMMLCFATLGGGLVPNAVGLSRQYTGTYFWGFALFNFAQ